MVRLSIKFSCGCGFKTDDQDKAIAHCENEGHMIPVFGYVVPGIGPEKEVSNDQTKDKE